MTSAAVKMTGAADGGRDEILDQEGAQLMVALTAIMPIDVFRRLGIVVAAGQPGIGDQPGHGQGRDVGARSGIPHLRKVAFWIFMPKAKYTMLPLHDLGEELTQPQEAGGEHAVDARDQIDSEDQRGQAPAVGVQAQARHRSAAPGLEQLVDHPFDLGGDRCLPGGCRVEGGWVRVLQARVVRIGREAVCLRVGGRHHWP